MRSGVFTATESSCVAVLYALLVTLLVYRNLDWTEFVHATQQAVRTTSMVLLIIGMAGAFGWLMAYLRVAQMTVDLMGAISQDPLTILLMINIILLVLGTFMDMSPLIIITTPIFLPVVTAFGVDPVHFGVIMILNLGIGLNTPPLGPVQFVAAAVGKITIWEAMKLDLAVLRRRARRAPARHLRPGAVALAAVALPLKEPQTHDPNH